MSETETAGKEDDTSKMKAPTKEDKPVDDMFAKFLKKDKLEAHTKNKHDDVTYNCDVCTFRTKFKRELKQHKELNHA